LHWSETKRTQKAKQKNKTKIDNNNKKMVRAVEEKEEQEEEERIGDTNT